MKEKISKFVNYQRDKTSLYTKEQIEYIVQLNFDHFAKAGKMVVDIM